MAEMDGVLRRCPIFKVAHLCILVVGQDSQGKALQTELLTSPGKPLAIRSETLGFHDHTCDATLNQFQEHLAERGVTINTTRRTRTLRQRLRSRVGVRQ